VNQACDSGNTPLHAAVNKGNLALVDILLDSISPTTTTTTDVVSNGLEQTNKLDVNARNPQCMDATPLHLAVWNNFNEIAIKLVRTNADPGLKMNGQSSAFDLARENANTVLLELLVEFSDLKTKQNSPHSTLSSS
jgi:ankyrin repeat protein